MFRNGSDARRPFRLVTLSEVISFALALAVLAYYKYATGSVPGHAGMLDQFPRTPDPILLPCVMTVHRIVYWHQNHYGINANWVFVFMGLALVMSLAYGSLYGLMTCPILVLTAYCIWKFRDA